MGKKKSKDVFKYSSAITGDFATSSIMGSGVMGYEKMKEKEDKLKQSISDAEAATNTAKEDAAKAAAIAAETEAQQEAVRKKMASLGRLQAGYTFSDSGASTGSTKVFS